ncbi:MAG: cell division protein CrgA [Jiangellaceae bacterium]|nr:cell division protein CrgA [Jiangellaceae bacterium]
MPKSRLRRRSDFTPPPLRVRTDARISRRWVAPTMVTLLLLGLVWLVVYYVTEGDLPLMSALGGWNLVVGMGLITAGFFTATKWK